MNYSKIKRALNYVFYYKGIIEYWLSCIHSNKINIL